MKASLSFLAPLLAAAYVQAHGFVHQITIDGKAFIGNVPNANPKPSIIRQINDVSPVKGADNPNINCGQHAQNAALVADANPGSVVTFDWKGGDLSNWPHNTGPMLTYMASCGSTTCDQFDSRTAKWFKIEETGRKSDGNWAQADLMAGGSAQVTLPSTIAPGNYLIRHEIIALHLGETEGGAEFYPSCAQLKIGGSQTGKPTDSELVSFPGAYSDTDPGIFDKDAYNAKASYNFPGPQVASFVGSDASSGGTDGGNSSSSSSTSAPKPKPTKSASTCKLKKSNKATGSVRLSARSTSRPHQLSRVMRNLISGHHHS